MILDIISGRQLPSGVGEHYQTAVDHILEQAGVEVVDSAGRVVPSAASWKDALQHTEYLYRQTA